MAQQVRKHAVQLTCCDGHGPDWMAARFRQVPTAVSASPERGTADGNCDGSDGSHQRSGPARDSHVLTRIWAELGICYTCESRRSKDTPVAGITKPTGCTVDNSLRMWTAEGAATG